MGSDKVKNLSAAEAVLELKEKKREEISEAGKGLGEKYGLPTDDVDAAVKSVVEAQKAYASLGHDVRQRVVGRIRELGLARAVCLGKLAAVETGRGVVEDKATKNRLVSEKTPGPEELECKAFTGPCGTTLVDHAPMGAILSITPTTNPTATVINNCITLLSGGNGVLFEPHPAAMVATTSAVLLCRAALEEAGAPPDAVSIMTRPSVDLACKLMVHPGLAANLITGGPAVVARALQSGKRSFCAGPGNPPSVVDETADLPSAVESLISGSSFDNNMVCSDEKSVIAAGEDVYGKLIEEFKANPRAVVLSPEQVTRMVEAIVKEGTGGCAGCEPAVKPDLAGAAPAKLLETAGLSGEVKLQDSTRLLIAPVGKEVEHTLIEMEQLCPILPVAFSPDFDAAVDVAARIENGRFHSASIHTMRADRATIMAQRVPVANFVLNGPNYSGLGAGGEGYTSFSIAGTTGEGYTTPLTFVKKRRFTAVNTLNFTHTHHKH